MKQKIIHWLAVIGLILPAISLANVEVITQSLRLQFSGQGDLLRVESCFPDCAVNHSQTRLLSAQQGMLVFPQQPASAAFTLERIAQKSATELIFSEAQNATEVRWDIPDQGWLVSVSLRGIESAQLHGGKGFRPAPSSGFGYLLEQSRYLFFDNGTVAIAGLDETQQQSRKASDWFGFRNRFWTAMLRPSDELDVTAVSGESVQNPRLEIQLSGNNQQFQLYLGPVEPKALKQTAAELEDLMYSGLWFWLRWLCQGLYYLLGWIFTLVPNWGIAIMVLSVLVGLLMKPLSKIADRLQDQVHEIDARIGPMIAAIKKDYKGARQSEKILAMYKQEQVHPLYSLKSLMGVFVVIPVFIGAFNMLAENIHLSGVAFMWIRDLSHPDAFMPLPFSLPFFGGYLNLLPFIMTSFSFLASKLQTHPAMNVVQKRKQSRNLILMSLAFLVLFYTFPAGMVLYWTTNNLISVIKMVWKRRKAGMQQAV